MTIPIPSAIRTVRIYSGAQMLATRGISPVVPYRWTPKHPLAVDWWWVDVTGWLTDPVGTVWDTIGQIATPTTLPDPALSIDQTIISADGMQAGIHLLGGTPGASPAIRIVLTTAATAQQWAGDIVLPIDNVAAVVTNPPNDGTLHGSVVTIGGLTYPIA